MDIQEVVDHTWIFLFQFSSLRDKMKVLLRQPWLFNKALIVFRDFDDDMALEDYDFRWWLFWLQLNNIPLRFMTKHVGRLLENWCCTRN